MSIVTGIPWRPGPYPDRLTGDVGRIHVRASSKRDYGLLLRDEDLPNAAFAHVVSQEAEPGALLVIGWIQCRHGHAIGSRHTYAGREECTTVEQVDLLPFPVPSDLAR